MKQGSIVPTVVTLVATIALALAPQAQAFITAHPTIALIAGAVGGIVNHWLPSPTQGK